MIAKRSKLNKYARVQLNPFEASKNKVTVSVPDVLSTSVSTTLSTQSSSLSFTAEMSSDSFDGSTIVEQLFITKSSPITESFSITVDKVTNELLNMKVDEKFDIERASDILTNIKTVAVPNPRIFVLFSTRDIV